VPTDSTTQSGRIPVLVETTVPQGISPGFALERAANLNAAGFEIDANFTPITMTAPPELASQIEEGNQQVILVRGLVDPNRMQDLRAQPGVIAVWTDTPISPFQNAVPGAQSLWMMPATAVGPCPLPPCDTTNGFPANGTLANVQRYLGVDQIWADGYRGAGIVIGIVDGGITAQNRPPRGGETAKVPRVIGGFPAADWGTTAAAWAEHGNMTATDALGMAPEAQLYDIRISTPDGGFMSSVSQALAGYQWAIDHHKMDGTPQVLSNSWGLYQQAWGQDYATNANHPFTRKVVEAINEGILVLFAAGNCGQVCPDGRCGQDTGPGRSIWAANAHPNVMTVGAANLSEQWVGYSSQGPTGLQGAQNSNKPDFCGITHFAGYFPQQNASHPSDSGTSAATPIVAGVVALLKHAKPSLTQDEVKSALQATAKNLGPTAGWNQHSGFGTIQAKAAYDMIRGVQPGPNGDLQKIGDQITELERLVQELLAEAQKKVKSAPRPSTPGEWLWDALRRLGLTGPGQSASAAH
jgi:serine protease AprX